MAVVQSHGRSVQVVGILVPSKDESVTNTVGFILATVATVLLP